MKRWAVLVLLQCIAFAAAAQDWPNRPMRLIVPFAPGGATDIPARLIAPKLQDALGQPVVIENRTGAGGIIGMQAGAQAQPDGYTLLMATNAEIVMHPSIYPKLPYDPLKDLAPVSIMVESPMLLVVPPGSPYNSVADLLAAAKAKPGALTFSTAGTGSTSHVLTEMMAQQAKVQFLHVPYKGGAPASTAVSTGEVNFALLNLGSAVNFVKGGKAKALAVTSDKRNPSFPDWPTAIEAGVPGFNEHIWIGMAVPAGTPRPIVERLSTEVAKALKAPDVRERLVQLGNEPLGTTPDEAAARIKREFPRYAAAIKAANIKAE
ncbi:MAG TPA: tripartite tricarboxylate transporter substrate binding protein [Burkholderiales bacterium]|jgi:tripartite-type tricarboxylate transporter receptor subunit TctC|nr:tripartite tricarboxylate transporter substrate binding protein [Burkholderiales bacterium]